MERAVIFYLLANPAETPYLSVRDGKLFNAVRLVEFRPRKVSAHTFWVVPIRAAQTAFVPELWKALFCLRSYPREISHSNSAKRELSNDVWLLECAQEKLHFTQVHTLCQLKRDEALFIPLGRVVEFRVRYRQIPVRGCFW